MELSRTEITAPPVRYEEYHKEEVVLYNRGKTVLEVKASIRFENKSGRSWVYVTPNRLTVHLLRQAVVTVTFFINKAVLKTLTDEILGRENPKLSAEIILEANTEKVRFTVGVTYLRSFLGLNIDFLCSVYLAFLNDR